MPTETEAEYLERLIERIRAGAAEAIRLEVAELKRLGLPVWVYRDGRVVDASKDIEEESAG